MDLQEHRFDGLTRSASGVPSRRHVLRGLAAAGLGWGVARLPGVVAARKRRKKRKKTKGNLCTPNGQKCNTQGETCQQQFCLRAPFTIAANWTQTSPHSTFLVVPREDGTTGPAPYIYDDCNPINSACEDDIYPFACIDHDVLTTGAEVAIIYRLLPGKYEYWVGLKSGVSTPAGEVSVVLKDSGGRVVQQWTNPASETNRRAWHIFDVDGRHGRVTPIDELIAGGAPHQVRAPSTDACPYDP